MSRVSTGVVLRSWLTVVSVNFHSLFANCRGMYGAVYIGAEPRGLFAGTRLIVRVIPEYVLRFLIAVEVVGVVGLTV